MKQNFFYLVLAYSGIMLSACTNAQNDRRNIREYYFPIEDLKSPLVYEYQPVNNDSTLGPGYWYFRTLETDTATYFTTNIYNRFFEVEQFSTEEVVSNGTMIKDYFLYAYDTSGIQKQLPAEIIYSNAFPFEVKDSTGVFLQELKWTFSESPLHTTTVVKNRRYISERKYDFQGKNYEAITFSIRELVDDFSEGHLETETSGEEIYAKGIGLVYFKKQISDKLSMEYKLNEIYTMKELEQKFSDQLEQPSGDN